MLSTYAVAPTKPFPYERTVDPAATSNVDDVDRNHTAFYADSISSIELSDNREPYGVAVSPDGKRVYVTTLFSGTVEVIDTATNSVVTSVRVGGITTGVSVTPDGKYLYIGESHGHIYAMNTATYALTTVMASANYPGKDVAVTPDGRYLYALDNVFNEILVIRTGNHAIAATITLEQAPQSITIARSSGLAYVGTDTASKAPSGSVTVIDTAIHMIVDTIPLVDGVKSVFLASDENHVYAVTDTSTVALDTETHTVAHLSEPLQTSTLERRGVQPSIGA
ncbi:hypothetical protein B2J88_28615 [Rhodococcus sp. SRB_17]|nr:hypothetical protein [Rhodococcus sp. SRB_17]